jgi:hypothetical protein
MASPLRRLALSALVAVTLAGCGGGGAGSGSAGSGQAGPTTAPSAPAPATTATPRPRPSPTSLRPPPPELGIVAARKRPAAPDLSVTAFDGRSVTLAGFRGQPVVVNFFESW